MIEDNKHIVIEDEDKFMECLDDLITDFATELKEKNK